MPDLPNDVDTEKEINFYQLRAAEYRDRYEHTRSLEWKILFQTYAGYATVIIAFSHLPDRWEGPFLSLLAVLGTVSIYLASRYLMYRIQERLIVFDETYEVYMAKIESLSKAHAEASPALGHVYYWTYHTQIVLSTLTLFGSVTYELAKGNAITVNRTAGLFVVALAFMLLGWRVKTPNQKSEAPKAPAATSPAPAGN